LGTAIVEVLFKRLFDGQLQTQKALRGGGFTNDILFLSIHSNDVLFCFNVRHPRSERVSEKRLAKKKGWHLASRFFKHFYDLGVLAVPSTTMPATAVESAAATAVESAATAAVESAATTAVEAAATTT
jgi:hypothetical protein